MERESEGQKTNNSQNSYINCSVPKVILSISFSDKMNKPISNIENKNCFHEEAKNRYNNYKNKEILKKYLTQGMPESITAMHNENDQQNRINNNNNKKNTYNDKNKNKNKNEGLNVNEIIFINILYGYLI